MRKILAFVLSCLTLPAFCQENQPVTLQWKIDKNEKLTYLTSMSEVDTASLKLDFEGLFKSSSDSTKKSSNNSEVMLKHLRSMLRDYEYVSTLTNKNDKFIDIVMTGKPKKESEKESKKTDKHAPKNAETEVANMLKVMSQGVVLRGSVYPTGEIHSFWLKNEQKNLIVLFFGLPSKPVKIGDTWKADISFIANDQNFQCDSSFKLNEVTLVDIKKQKGEKIAVIKYNIVEYVNGTFYNPFMNNATPSMMHFSYQGMAEFSVDKGHWISYVGIVTLNATGAVNAKAKTKNVLLKE